LFRNYFHPKKSLFDWLLASIEIIWHFSALFGDNFGVRKKEAGNSKTANISMDYSPEN
jgi:hypothetical protein